MVKTQPRPGRIAGWRRWLLVLGALIGLGAALWALGGPRWRTEPGRPAAGPPADFAIETVDGGRFALADHRGKVVGVLFLASWCASCLVETQAWGRIVQEYGPDRVVALLVSADPADTPADLERFPQQARGPERFWAIDRDGRALVLPFRVQTLDTTLLFDRQGRLAYRDTFPTPYETLKREVERLLREGG